MSAFGGKADMPYLHCKCLLLTQSGHSLGFNIPYRQTRYDTVGVVLGKAMRRRDFIRGVLGSAAVWPLPALAQQQPGRVRLIGALTGIADGPELKVRYAAFRQELQRLGWIDGQNVRIDVRFGEGNAARMRKQAAELVALSPDVILTTGGQAAELVLQATRTIPIVFATRTRSGRLWPCREPCGTRGQCDRLCAIRIQSKRQMAGTAQGNCA